MSDPTTKKCACGGEMAVGFIPDHGGMASVLTAVYVSGTPKARASLWQKIQKGAGLKGWAEEDAWALTAYRCGECGKVDIFAVDRPDPELTFQPRD